MNARRNRPLVGGHRLRVIVPMAIALMAIGIVATRTNAADAIPPLTDQDRARLEAAVDGRDYRDEAFVALRDHAATWTGATPGAEPIRLEPDVEALLADPAAARGALCRVVGVLQQQHPVDASYGPASEWFVRRTDGRVLIVYVAGAPVIADGAPVAVVARWYKPISLVARDGVERTYPAFVGAMPATGGGDGASAPWPLMGGVVIALFVVFAFVRRRARSGGRRPVDPIRGSSRLDDPDDLPDDPADALAELRRRAERAEP